MKFMHQRCRIPVSNFCFWSLSGRNDKGQLGHGDTKRLEAPKLVEGLGEEVIVAAACGRNHTMALTGRKHFATCKVFVVLLQ